MHDYPEGRGHPLALQRDGAETHGGEEPVFEENERDTRELAGGSRDLDQLRRTNLLGIRVLSS